MKRNIFYEKFQIKQNVIFDKKFRYDFLNNREWIF